MLENKVMLMTVRYMFAEVFLFTLKYIIRDKKIVYQQKNKNEK